MLICPSHDSFLQKKWLSRKCKRVCKVLCIDLMLFCEAHFVAVPMSYQDLWEALQANKFVVEDTIEHLMAQMASQGL
jgi:hypothetical protein